MHVGFSRRRLGYESTPSHDGIFEFGKQLADKTGYNLIAESIESRVALLSKRQRSMIWRWVKSIAIDSRLSLTARDVHVTVN